MTILYCISIVYATSDRVCLEYQSQRWFVTQQSPQRCPTSCVMVYMVKDQSIIENSSVDTPFDSVGLGNIIVLASYYLATTCIGPARRKAKSD